MRTALSPSPLHCVLAWLPVLGGCGSIFGVDFESAHLPEADASTTVEQDVLVGASDQHSEDSDQLADATDSPPPRDAQADITEVDSPSMDASDAESDTSGGDEASCSGPSCPAVALVPLTGVQGGYAITLDSDCVYWTMAYHPVSVRKAKKDGSHWETLFSDPSSSRSILGIAVDDSFVYWPNGGRIMRIPKTGGTAEPVLTHGENISGIAVQGGILYWTDFDLHTVMALNLSDNTEKILARDLGMVSDTAVGGGSVFWTSAMAVWKVTPPDTTPVGVKDCMGFCSHVIATETDAFWIEGEDVWTTPTAGGDLRRLSYAPTTDAVSLADPNYFIAVDEDSVYATRYDSVRHIARTGGPVSILAPNQGDPKGIVADETGVYWVNYDGVPAVVMKIPK